MSFISVVTPCFNEEENIEELYKEVKKIINTLSHAYEHIFIDNASTDNTIKILKKIAKMDRNVKLILNSRNFGSLRSPYYAMLQSSGDAILYMAADFQDPPALIIDLIKKWEEGFKIVVGVKQKSNEFLLMWFVRKVYYKLIQKVSEASIINNFTGFGLYDKSIIKVMRNFKDTTPFFRGIISEIGFEVEKIFFHQPSRKHGKSKLNLYHLYDIGMVGLINHSKLPLRIITFVGLVLSLLSLGVAFFYMVLKLFFWKVFTLGLAPILIGLFCFFSFQLFILGLLGEYILAIHDQVLNRPLVIEKERVNF